MQFLNSWDDNNLKEFYFRILCNCTTVNNKLININDVLIIIIYLLNFDSTDLEVRKLHTLLATFIRYKFIHVIMISKFILFLS